MPSGQQQQQHDDDRSSLAIHTVGIPRTDFPILPEDIILGMCCAEHTVDIYDFMSKVLMEQSMSPSFSVEEHPDLAKLFHVLREDVGRVQCNPFWMLVSYVPSRNMWEPAKSDFRYRIDDMPDLEAICKSAKGLHDRLHAAVTTDIMWCEMSEMSRTSLKMVLACLWLVAGKLFPCMAVVSWGYANRRPASKLVTRDDFGNSRSWAVPAGSTKDVIFQPARDATQAPWHFASATGIIVLGQVPGPTASQMLAVASRHVDTLLSNFKAVQDFLLAGEMDMDKIDPLVGAGLFWTVPDLVNYMYLEALRNSLLAVAAAVAAAAATSESASAAAETTTTTRTHISNITSSNNSSNNNKNSNNNGHT